jgi:hypothetical protein
MTKTTKYLLAGGAAIVGVIAYRRWKATQSPAAQAPSTAAAAVSSLASKLSTQTATFLQQLGAQAPVALPSGGQPYGTVDTTDLRKEASMRPLVPASEVYRTPAQNSMLGINIYPRVS